MLVLGAPAMILASLSLPPGGEIPSSFWLFFTVPAFLIGYVGGFGLRSLILGE